MIRLNIEFLVMRNNGAVIHAEICNNTRPDFMLAYPVDAMMDADEFLTAAQKCCCGSDAVLGRMVKQYVAGGCVTFEGEAEQLPDIGSLTVTVETKEVVIV